MARRRRRPGAGPAKPTKGGGAGRSGRAQDRFGHQARREGYPARSVYKLEEIDKRVGLLRAGQRVLDLGAYPGSWALYAAKRVGSRGEVIGIDLQPYEGATPPNLEMRQGDVLALEAGDFGGPASFDVVMSDMAPATTGKKDLDQYRSYELVLQALRIAETLLRPGGTFVAKIFQGAEFPEAKKAVQAVFGKVRVIRPKAVRTESYEVFLVGLDRRPPKEPSILED